MAGPPAAPHPACASTQTTWRYAGLPHRGLCRVWHRSARQKQHHRRRPIPGGHVPGVSGGQPAQRQRPVGRLPVRRGTASNTIAGNLIGTDPTGKLAWGNQRDGVHINGAHHNLIAGNVISGKTGSRRPDLLLARQRPQHGPGQPDRRGPSTGQTPVPNVWMGVVIAEGANHNTIGPGNVIANTNSGGGIGILGRALAGQYHPGQQHLWQPGERHRRCGMRTWTSSACRPSPTFDLAAGVAGGVACPDCLVQIYSDEDNEGRVFEGQARGRRRGRFLFDKGWALPAPTSPPPRPTPAAPPACSPCPPAAPDPSGCRPATPIPSSHPRLACRPVGATTGLGFYVQDQSWVDGGIADADRPQSGWA